jgi:nucleoside-diphosphate-sugar epimerase
LNTSNERVRDLLQGKSKGASEIPETGVFIWVDVRDVANAHVKAMEVADAGNKRFFVVAGTFCNKDLVDIIRKNFKEYADQLPKEDATGGTKPDKMFSFDNSRSKDVLGLKYMDLQTSIKDLVVSLEEIGI